MVDRIMVGLPTLQSRELILKTLLSKEKVDEKIDFKELATMTEGYSGSDLKVSKLFPICCE
jgi:ATP-dependent Zn protease